jgi:hypothetical protein
LVRYARSTSGRGNRASARAGEILHCLVTASLLRQLCQRFLQPGLYPTVHSARSDKDRSRASASASIGNPATRPVEASPAARFRDHRDTLRHLDPHRTHTAATTAGTMTSTATSFFIGEVSH